MLLKKKLIGTSIERVSNMDILSRRLLGKRPIERIFGGLFGSGLTKQINNQQNKLIKASFNFKIKMTKVDLETLFFKCKL